jgi:hypothetical protein
MVLKSSKVKKKKKKKLHRIALEKRMQHHAIMILCFIFTPEFPFALNEGETTRSQHVSFFQVHPYL